MIVSLSDNSITLAEKYRFYGSLRGFDMRGVVLEQSRSYGRRLVRDTPPRTRKQGRDRVVAQLRRLFFDPGPQNLTQKIKNPLLRKRIHQLVAAQNISGLQKLLDNMGIDAKVIAGSELKRVHEANRNSVGNVRKKVDSHWVIERGSLAQYIERKRSHVGMGKAGWAKGQIAAGGKAANWITTHTSRVGQFKDRSGLANNPFFEITNDTAWGSGGHAERVMRSGVIAQAKAFERALLFALDRAAQRAKL